MHKIFELKGMDLDQLQNLASELGMKGYKKMDKDALVYGILDEEARQNAQNAPEKPAQKKRGRPKKSEGEKAVKKEAAESEKKVEIIDKVIAYKKKGYPIMNSKSGLKLMKRNALGQIELGKECFVTNFIYTEGTRGLCLGYGTEQCRVCGFCMAGEMASVWHFKLDTILAGFNLRM